MTAAGDSTDLAELTLPEIRSRRSALQGKEDAVSYARRVAQARLDLVRRRLADHEAPLTDGLPEVLGQQALAPSGRPPRDTGAHDDSPPAVELDELCARLHFSRLGDLGVDELEQLSTALEEFETRISADRRALFDEIDALSNELVNRYRDGAAEVDQLWDDGDDDGTP